MKRAVLIITSVLALDFALPAQVVPGQYIVELQGDPAVRFSTSRQIRYSTLDPQTVARRAEIRAEHDPIEQAVVARGGRVLVHYDTILNGMAVAIQGTNKALQVIVLDHASDSVWGSMPLVNSVEDWRDGRALIPQAWINNARK